ncbi:hypothetical protein [Pedobacter aquatilis]|uniref:hypothetical protein n=1 Tax=Pedobacter aquatilis TaxID=351343 RepID=UPI00293053C0|nr:hypothetical protein [Pedobacter aquatilis]
MIINNPTQINGIQERMKTHNSTSLNLQLSKKTSRSKVQMLTSIFQENPPNRPRMKQSRTILASMSQEGLVLQDQMAIRAGKPPFSS